MNKLTKKQLETLTLKELANHYNSIMEATEGKQIKKFSTKDQAVERTLKAQKLLPSDKKSAKSRGNYTLDSKIVLTDKKATDGSAMALIREAVTKKGTKAEIVIKHFMDNYVQPRGKKEVDFGFARGYLTGAIRLGFVEVSKGK